MFGQYYAQRDAALLAATGPASVLFCQASYACDLLEDILNRGLALEGALRCHQEYPGAANELENAVALFIEDVREASVRGRRARLFATDSNSERECERVSACNAEPEDRLAKIGGPLCPEVSVYDLSSEPKRCRD